MRSLDRSLGARIILVLAILVCAVGSAVSIHDQPALYFPRGIGRWLDLTFIHRPAVLVVMLVAITFGAGCWAFRYRQQATGLVAFVVVALLSVTEHALRPDDLGVRHGKFLPGAVLFFYLLFYAAYRGHRYELREAQGTAAACGAVAAIYFLAFASKVAAGGLAWGQGGGLALIIASQIGDGSTALGALRAGVAVRPVLVDSLCIGTLIVEAGGGLFILPRARKWVALATTAMHLGIYVLVGFGYVFLWSPLVLALAYSSFERRGHPVARASLAER